MLRRRSPPSGHGRRHADRRSGWQVEPRDPRRQAFIFLRDSATKRRETADFAVATAFARGALGQTNLRVDTFSTIRFAQGKAAIAACHPRRPVAPNWLFLPSLCRPSFAMCPAPAITSTGLLHAQDPDRAAARTVEDLLDASRQGLDPGQKTPTLNGKLRVHRVRQRRHRNLRGQAAAGTLLGSVASLLGLQHPLPRYQQTVRVQLTPIVASHRTALKTPGVISIRLKSVVSTDEQGRIVARPEASFGIGRNLPIARERP